MVGDLEAAALGNATSLGAVLPAAVLSGEPDRQCACLVELGRPIRIVGQDLHAAVPEHARAIHRNILVESQVGENTVVRWWRTAIGALAVV